MADEQEPVDSHEDSTTAEPELDGLPAGALLERLMRPGRDQGLDATTVSAELMSVAVAVGVSWLTWHVGVCRQPDNCHETPGPLRRFHKMPRAIPAQRQVIHQALWSRKPSPMCENVKKEVRARYPDLATKVESAEVFDRQELAGLFGPEDKVDIREVAAVLWASGFVDPRAELLFRLLPVIAGDLREERSEPRVQPPAAPEPSEEKGRHRRTRQRLEAEKRELQSDLDRAKADIRIRAEELGRTRLELESRDAQVASDATRITELTSEVEPLGRERDAAAARGDQLERQLASATQAADALRSDLTRTQQDLADIEAIRSALVRDLAMERAAMESLRAELRAIPRDREAIADWLAREEERLGRDLNILQGGDKQRALDEKRLRRKLELAFLEAYPGFRTARPTAIGERHSIRFKALGGGDEVGRSAYYLELGPHRLLVDCGIAVGARNVEDQFPDISAIDNLHALLITHAHTDHVGWIPALVAQVAEPFRIYCTRPTAELLPIMLDDSRKHYERGLAEEQFKRSYNPLAPEAVEAYTRDDIHEATTRLVVQGVGNSFAIAARDVTATFYSAGHILGAASILVESGGRRILFSGDVFNEHQHTAPPFSLPWDLEPVDLLILESTYGGKRREALSVAESELVAFVRETVAQGIALLPCFALGRAQEVLRILVSAKRAGKIPADTRIVVDGMINKINPVFADVGMIDPRDFILVGGTLDREMLIKQRHGPSATPTVVVTTSGMLSGGPVIDWAARLLPDQRNRMALLGYQDEGAPGGALRTFQKDRPPYPLKLRGEDGEEFTVRVAGKVADIRLSAHADQDGLVAYASAARPRQIVLVHGDDSARQSLRERIVSEGICADVSLDTEILLP